MYQSDLLFPIYMCLITSLMHPLSLLVISLCKNMHIICKFFAYVVVLPYQL